MSDTTVKLFTGDMTGAPVWDTTPGTTISVLDACLVNGFGTVAVNSLVVSGGAAVVTVTAGHGLMAGVGAMPVISVSGATPAELNGEWRVSSIYDAQQFAFPTPAISNQTAGGAITVKRSGAGWTKLYSAFNKAVYRRNTASATDMVLLVDDTGGQNAQLRMYESMSSIDIGTGPSAGAYTMRPLATPSIPWTVAASGHAMYLFSNSAGGGVGLAGFGDIAPYKQSDAYHAILYGFRDPGDISGYEALTGDATNLQIARTATQLGGAISGVAYGHPRNPTVFSQKTQPIPAGIDGAIHTFPVEVWDDVGDRFARGFYRGILDLVHEDTFSVSRTILAADNGRKLFVQPIGHYDLAIDITGPW